MENSPITPSELMQKLAQAKKVMKKVDSGDFKRGQVNENILRSDPSEIDPTEFTKSFNSNNYTPNNEVDLDRINNSKLPDSIKRAMIESPIPKVSLSDGIDSKIVQGAKRLMEKENPSQAKSDKQTVTFPINEIINRLTPVIENSIRKIMDEKLNQILSAQQTMSINEDLVLKVGDSVFKGRITGVNKSK